MAFFWEEHTSISISYDLRLNDLIKAVNKIFDNSNSQFASAEEAESTQQLLTKISQALNAKEWKPEKEQLLKDDENIKYLNSNIYLYALIEQFDIKKFLDNSMIINI